MSTPKTIFYAYPSTPPELGETIEAAAKEVSDSGIARVTSWRNLAVAGKLLLGAIDDGIERAEIFACDLTYLNSNVLFELGIAIGRSKRLWISLDPDISDAAANYRKLETILGPLGYASYGNRVELARAFYAEQPWLDLQPSVNLSFGEVPIPARPTLLYLKSSVDSDASIALSELLHPSGGREVIVDDPREIPSETLDWYIRGIRRADALVVHLSSTIHANSAWHNAKCSLVAGLAHGFTKPVLMLAHEPFTSPIDYQGMLRTHATASQCRSMAQASLAELDSEIARHRSLAGDYLRSQTEAAELRFLSVGEAIAENEADEVLEYFIETSAYLEALRSKQAILVGRKGTGKTANLYVIAGALGRDKRNYICTIKPVGYEIDGVLRMLKQSIAASEKGYLIESLWKFLIYSELARTLAEELRSLPIHYALSDGERSLLKLVREHPGLIEPAFSIRLQASVESLQGLEGYREGDAQRTRISELLHGHIIRDLRESLGRALAGRNRVVVLVDNLDKTWGSGADISYLIELLSGLLGVARGVRDDFAREDHWRKAVDVSLLVFLRSDIFSIMQTSAREKDKLEFTRLTWEEPQLLIRMLERRLSYFMDVGLTPDQIWRKFFVASVGTLPVKQFIVDSTLPRPRDVIYLVKTAIAEAVNRGHQVVSAEDLVSARKKYSQFAFDSLIAEDNPEFRKLEAVLYEFAGAVEILNREEVSAHIRNGGVGEGEVPWYFDLLCDLNFLGISVGDNEYEFPQDEARRRVIQSVAAKVAEHRGTGQEWYRINPVFHPVLQIERPGRRLL